MRKNSHDYGWKIADYLSKVVKEKNMPNSLHCSMRFFIEDICQVFKHF